MNIYIKPKDDRWGVRFDKHPDLINAIRSVPGRHWHMDKLFWSIPSTEVSQQALLRALYQTGLFNEPEERETVVVPTVPVPMDPLVKITEALKAHHYSERTVKTYTEWLKRYLEFKKTHVKIDNFQEDLNRFATHLAVKGHVSPSTQNQAIAAVLFYLKHVVGVDPHEFTDIVRVVRTGGPWCQSP